MLARKRTACLLKPSDIAPSRPDFEVVGAFNPGAVSLGKQGIALMVRVAERPLEKRSGFTPLPRWNTQSGEIEIDWAHHDDIELLDPRVVKIRKTGLVRLTFISHIQVFRGAEPFGELLSDKRSFVPEKYYEEFGIEDPRIVCIDGRYLDDICRGVLPWACNRPRLDNRFSAFRSSWDYLPSREQRCRSLSRKDSRRICVPASAKCRHAVCNTRDVDGAVKRHDSLGTQRLFPRRGRGLGNGTHWGRSAAFPHGTGMGGNLPRQPKGVGRRRWGLIRQARY